MPRDELRQPLRKRSLGERLWAKRPSAFATVATGVLALFLGGGIWITRIPHPFAGEPIVTAAIPPVEELKTASTDPAKSDAKTDDEAAANPEDVIDENAAVASDDSAAPVEPPAYQNEAMIITAPNRPLKAAPVDAVTEGTADGPLPKIARNGKKPFDVYSQVTPSAVLVSERPKITILLGGMGLNQRLTEKAINELPGDISLGFAPYGDNLQAQVNKARARGHEVMLQVPMEPIGYPQNNPGPKTLLADAPPADNLEALRWHMSRFAGYSGVTNYMGARLLVSGDAMLPLMKEIKSRGLVYLEDASVNLTMTPKIAQPINLPVERATTVIDADPTPAAIADALAQLEKEAERNGHAIATGSGLEVTIDAVAVWAQSLQDKGILLVPISASYRGRQG